MGNIGLGLAALGRPGYINLGHAQDLEQNYSITAMRARSHAMLDLAWESGVRYFDAARSYGRAEEFLGSWILARDISPVDISVGSKWGYAYTAAWQVQTPEGVEHEVKRHELPVLQSQYAATLKNLGTHLSLYQIHSATMDSGVLENEEVLQFLDRIRQAGIKIGLSVSGPRQSETILKALTIKIDGQPLFASVQATWNLLEKSAGPALQKANASGLDVIIKEGLANGRLTSRNLSPEFAEKRQILAQIAQDLDTSMDAISLAACLQQPWATTVLSGAATPTHLQSNLRARDVLLNEPLMNRLDAMLELPEQYWKTRSALIWN